MANDFDACLAFVLKWEGGYVNDPDDPGGATNRGVTQAVYDAWRARQGEAARDVRQLSDDELSSIYRGQYWAAVHGDDLPADLDLAAFDTAVNGGPGRAVRFLQAAVGVGVDGDFGAGTLAAVQAADAGTALKRFCDAREAFYDAIIAKNPKLAKFRGGWMNRLNALRKQVQLPGYESVDDIDTGGPMGHLPDFGEDSAYDIAPG